MNIISIIKIIFLSLSTALILGGCSVVPKVLPEPAFSRLLPEQANDITIYAVGLVGTPYRYGGNTPDSGFDCSGLIGYVYQSRAGFTPPRTVSKLQNWGQPVTSDSARSGDLVLFSKGGAATHAGIYVGAGRFVHAPSTGGEVRLDLLTSKYWSKQQIVFRRP